MDRLLLIFILTFLISCKNDGIKDAEKHSMIHWYRTDSTFETDTVSIDVSIRNDLSEYYIIDNNKDTLAISYRLYNNNDSVLYISGMDCPLVFLDSIWIENRNYLIKKYYFDIENMYDEEMSYFIAENYGLLAGYNDGWSDLIFSIEYDDISKRLVDSIINRSHGIFLRHNPPPDINYDTLILNDN